MEGIGDTIRVSLTGDPEREVETGIELLKAVELRAQGLHLVCCPTCGRCGNVAKHSEIYERVKAEFKREKRPLKIAVMGCAVNGPGEAKEADIGLALGRTNAVLFKKGEQIAAYDIDTAGEELIRQAKQMGSNSTDGSGKGLRHCPLRRKAEQGQAAYAQNGAGGAALPFAPDRREGGRGDSGHFGAERAGMQRSIKRAV